MDKLKTPELLEKAAEQGDTDAMRLLALKCYDGDGLPQDKL
jgi:TPR repeat protein